MSRSARTYTLKVRRTEDGQLRLELRALGERPRYFGSLEALLDHLKKEWGRATRGPHRSS